MFGWTADEATSFTLLDAFVDGRLQLHRHRRRLFALGARPQGGESETDHRQVAASAAAGATRSCSPPRSARRWARAQGAWPRPTSAQAVEDSLRRLQTDCIDLYQSHRDDAATPLEETLEAYAELIKAGKVRAIGASNFTRRAWREALAISRRHGLPRYESLQPHLQPLRPRRVREDLRAALPATRASA